jgi:hypothetical protein
MLAMPKYSTDFKMTESIATREAMKARGKRDGAIS